jgi:ankyrin repeat protein
MGDAQRRREDFASGAPLDPDGTLATAPPRGNLLDLPVEMVLAILEWLIKIDPVTALGSVPAVSRRMNALTSGVRGTLDPQLYREYSYPVQSGMLKAAIRQFPKLEGLSEIVRHPLQNQDVLGNLEVFKKVLAEKLADIDTFGEEGLTPLGTASAFGKVGVVKVLLESGARIDAEDRNGDTALGVACYSGEAESVSIVQVLLAAGADPNAADDEGTTPLMILCKRDFDDIEKRVQIAELLIAAKASPLPLVLASRYAGNSRLVRLFLENGADVNRKDGFDVTALGSACCSADDTIVRMLLNAGAAVNEPFANGQTPLVAACASFPPSPTGRFADRFAKGCRSIVQMLLERGARVNEKNSDGDTPLTFACLTDLQIVQLLLERGADVNVRNFDGDTPLTIACRKDFRIVQLLLEKGAHVNVANTEGFYPLGIACKRNNEYVVNHLEMAKLLVAYNANIDSRNEPFGETPLLLSCQHNPGVAGFLLEKGAAVNASNDLIGDTPLIAASAHNNVELAKLLLNHSADINKADNEGRTPLQAAQEWEAGETERLLIRRGATRNT